VAKRIVLALSFRGLGLIGFVFSSVAGRNNGVNLCDIRGCGGFGVVEIGFVLRKKGRFVEGARQV